MMDGPGPLTPVFFEIEEFQKIGHSVFWKIDTK